MNFNELEKVMAKNGVHALAEIARTLSTTPQAVSNWKSRDQVPYHVVSKINSLVDSKSHSDSKLSRPLIIDEKPITLTDIFLTLAQQIKIILLVPFIAVFFSFTYVQFLQKPVYTSSATILLPENNTNNAFSGVASIASQFGVSFPSASGFNADLSSPSLFPELIRSRVFTNRMLEKSFYSEKTGKKLPLLDMLIDNNLEDGIEMDILNQYAYSSFQSMIKFNNEGSFSILKVIAPEPKLARDINFEVINELQKLNRYYKNQNVGEKISFVNDRINALKIDLKNSEENLKVFLEQNRQLVSPALKLELERLTGDVEIQREVFLTLKQQLELAKIESIQKSSIVQILDKPEIPLGSSNIKLKSSLLVSIIIGLGLGTFIAFFRTYFQGNIDERKKIRRVKNFIRKKSKDFFYDKRISGTISVLLLIGLPIYLGHKSENPIYFGMYSLKLFIVNIVYILLFLFSTSLFFYLKNKKNK